MAEVKDQGIIGIGVGGSEHIYPPEPFAALYEEARRWGFRTTVHAGEAAGPRSIWGALESLQPDRIGHGTRAVEDKRLFDHLIARRIPGRRITLLYFEKTTPSERDTQRTEVIGAHILVAHQQIPWGWQLAAFNFDGPSGIDFIAG